MRLVEGKNPIYELDENKYDVVLVGTSYYQNLANGFQYQMRLKYPYIEEENNRTNFGDKRMLGTLHLCERHGEDPLICFCYICNYPTNRRYLDYSALEKCIRLANARFSDKRVVSTLMGASRFDGNGEKVECLDMFGRYGNSMDITLYDYEQKTRRGMEMEASRIVRRLNAEGASIKLKDWKREHYIL